MEEFVNLLDSGAPMKRIMRQMSMDKDDVIRNIHFLPYYRKFLALRKHLRTKLKFADTPEERQRAQEQKLEMREELKEIHRRCRNELRKPKD